MCGVLYSRARQSRTNEYMCMFLSNILIQIYLTLILSSHYRDLISVSVIEFPQTMLLLCITKQHMYNYMYTFSSPYSAGMDFIRPNLTSVDVIF